MNDQDASVTIQELYSEEKRLRTFRCWPPSAAVSPAGLAKAGFYYLGQADRVRCAFCAGTVVSWQVGDHPWAEHQRLFPQCSFMQGLETRNIPLPTQESGDRSVSALAIGERSFPQPAQGQGEDIDPDQRLSPLSAADVIHPNLMKVERRLETFNNWPQDIVQRPQDLAQAGFFYTRGDRIAGKNISVV